MKKVVMTAVFTGANGSCGYEHGKEYALTATMYKGNIAIAPTEASTLLHPAEYESIFSFTANWTNIQVQGHGVAPERDLTFGEKAVGISFNPGGSPVVNRIKRMNADLVDLYNDERAKSGQGDKGRMFSTAITETQSGQMWGVKAETWQY